MEDLDDGMDVDSAGAGGGFYCFTPCLPATALLVLARKLCHQCSGAAAAAACATADAGMLSTLVPAGLPEGAAAAAGIDAQRLLSMQQLELQMERARRAGKPLIISRLPTSGDAQPHGAYIQASAAACV